MRSLFKAMSLVAVMAAAGGTYGVIDANSASEPQQPRRGPSPFLQDSIRLAAIAGVMKTVAGRENEPAGTVFKNVTLHKDMPVKDFLKKMDEEYGRGVGAVCSSCHVVGEWDKDEKKNKVITRQMERMVRSINEDHLAKTEDLDEDYPKATCALCHRGTLHPPVTMPRPDRNTLPAPQRGAPPTPPSGL